MIIYQDWLQGKHCTAFFQKSIFWLCRHGGGVVVHNSVVSNPHLEIIILLLMFNMLIANPTRRVRNEAWGAWELNWWATNETYMQMHKCNYNSRKIKVRLKPLFFGTETVVLKAAAEAEAKGFTAQAVCLGALPNQTKNQSSWLVGSTIQWKCSTLLNYVISASIVT